MVGTAAAPAPAATTGSRPTSAANWTPASTPLIGPHGTPAEISSRNHCAALRRARQAASSGRSSSRFAVRSPVRAKRASSARSGTPSTAHSLRNCASLPAVTIRSPSPVGSGSYGNRLGWEFPIRNGVSPPAT